LSTRDRTTGIHRSTTALVLFALILVSPTPTQAYLQDQQLESALRHTDTHALSLLPAKGYKDGAAGFFRDYDLYVVPHTERAWCNDKPLGVLPSGCYIEFYFQQQGRKANADDGTPCGFLGRWHRPPGSRAYQPTPGAFYSLAIAIGNYDEVMLAFEERPLPSDLNRLRQIDECESPAARMPIRSGSR
jgi:hypothetical protein